MAQPGYRPVARPGRPGPLAARLLPARGAHAATGQPTVVVLVLLSVGSGLALVGVSDAGRRHRRPHPGPV